MCRCSQQQVIRVKVVEGRSLEDLAEAVGEQLRLDLAAEVRRVERLRDDRDECVVARF
jgi:hypothetical protein